MLRIERHRLGPRVYVLGTRIHEWHLGSALLLGLVAATLAHRVDRDGHIAAAALFGGVWLVAKDWRDLLPSRRDTAAWALGLHVPPHPLRALRRGAVLPKLAALAAVVAGLVNLASAVTPGIAWRDHLLLQIAPLAALRISHAIAVPASMVLFVTAPYLWRRRQGAYRLALVVLVGLGLLNLLKGLDLEEAFASFAVAGLLWLGRSSFCVRHDPVGLRSALRRIPLIVGGGLLLCGLAVWLSAPWGTPVSAVVRETFDSLLWRGGPIRFHDDLAGVDEAVGVVGLLMLLWCAYLFFRPLAAPRALPSGETRHVVRELVRRHGADTLAYFKLRRDQHYLFSPDETAFLGYRVEAGVLLVSGDPVGPDDAIPGLLRELSGFAEARGLHIAAIGVGERMLPLWRQLGLRSLYLGDEAVVETNAFSLDGRPIRKVRQSVTRLEKQGYRATLHELRDLTEADLLGLEEVSSRWRGGTSERGFAMSLDALRREDHGDSLVVLGRDEEGRIRGFLHFAPSYGRAAVSLSLMRRDPETPNGLTEFLVARGLEQLRERGVEEASLNFAAFARFIHDPRGPIQRLLGRGLLIADVFFQIERLYRFNAKFFPRWEPRYLLFERALGLPRVGLAAMWAEGQLPKPSVLRR
ncbi:MAG TPA: phosphatidylglycerol lysyltransferase domain-containing protein [Gaiellaceae bacterium]|nr:phosphatidylglycerol lysyltransferase domain-containing protein [Gaiellaceae bacterium]